MEYQDDIKQIKGIGDKMAKLFNKLSVFNVSDLIELYPREYDRYEKIVPIENLTVGKVATIEGFINNIPMIKTIKKLNIINVMFKDETASIHLTWYNMPFLKTKLRPGARFIIRGKVILKRGMLCMEQPDFITKEEYYNSLNTLKPIYPLTKGLSNKLVIKAVREALSEVNTGKDYLDSKIRKKYGLLDYKSAIKKIHFPMDNADMIAARKRIVFDEFFMFSLALKQLKEREGNDDTGIIIGYSDVCDKFISSLGYALTGAQAKAFSDIRKDLESGKCMNRLVQGDVGCGKTVIAQLSLLMTAKAGYQGLLMAPTEVLARQHYEGFVKSFEPYGVSVGLLVGSMTAKEKRIMYEKIKNHEVDIIIGTVALIQEKAQYDNVALVVTDEQHRFGVAQRHSLADKGINPHMLVMSATPIPRTLAIILYGELDISVIDELPKGRQHIKNCVVNTGYRPSAYEFIKKEIALGRQAYVICPMVEENEESDACNVVGYCESLRKIMPENINIEYLHGAMKGKQKNDIMTRFATGEINILVSTTVVEVGVNVPNATVMMIENADRFGLATLHQLRGRVGRGDYQSYCIMINTSEAENVAKRLDILNRSDDGFYIANEDLKMRGPGELFGTVQSGELYFKLGDVFNDADTMIIANEISRNISKDEYNKLIKENEIVRERMECCINRATL